jgi:biopolymer transport protein ExbB/TolQ
MIETAVRFFQEGGFFMYPIAVVLVIGVIVAAERYIYLSAQKMTNRRDFNRLHEMISKKDLKGALNYANEAGSAMASMLGFGLQRLARRQSREEIEYAMEEGLLEVMPRLEKRTQYLSTLANISTLLGLLGTIIGLIAAFTAVASADPSQKASLLSQSISVAMNTTAFGLMSAIPLLLVHSVLQTKTNEIIDSFEMAGIKVLNLINDGTGGRPASAPRAPQNDQPASTAGSMA